MWKRFPKRSDGGFQTSRSNADRSAANSRQQTLWPTVGSTSDYEGVCRRRMTFEINTRGTPSKTMVVNRIYFSSFRGLARFSWDARRRRVSCYVSDPVLNLRVRHSRIARPSTCRRLDVGSPGKRIDDERALADPRTRTSKKMATSSDMRVNLTTQTLKNTSGFLGFTELRRNVGHSSSPLLLLHLPHLPSPIRLHLPPRGPRSRVCYTRPPLDNPYPHNDGVIRAGIG